VNKVYVLDACALIAFLQDEEGAEKVGELLAASQQHACELVMNKVNLLEVYYCVCREQGAAKAEEVLRLVRGLPLNIIDCLSDHVFREAGRLKSTHRVSLADAIALAEAMIRGAEIVTADHHEFDLLEKQGELIFCWIR